MTIYRNDLKHIEVYRRDVDGLLAVVINSDEKRNSVNKVRFQLSREQAVKLISDLQDGMKEPV